MTTLYCVSLSRSTEKTVDNSINLTRLILITKFFSNHLWST